MTSRNYLCNSIKENIRRNFYLLILISLSMLTVLPIFTIMRLENVGTYRQNNALTSVQNEFLSCIGPTNAGVFAVVAAAAVLLAFSGFFYLYSGEKADFYHSLPLKREELFMISFISSILIFVVPYLISVGLAYGVGTIYGGISREAVRAMGAAVGINLLFFLVIYTIGIMAVLITGNLFTGILALAGFMSYGFIVYLAYEFMNNRFFDTLGYFSDANIENFLSPLSTYAAAIGTWDEKGGPVNRYIIMGVILCVVFLAADICIYKIRPSESFQKSIAFQKLQPIIKVCCVIPISILAALAFSTGMDNSFLWMVIAVLVIALLLSSAFEFLYTMDVRKCIKPQISTGIILAALIVILGGYRTDIMGVDAYLPKKEKLESMSIYLPSINDRIHYPGEASALSYNYTKSMQENRVENFDDIYKLAEIGVAYYDGSDRPEPSDDIMDESTMVNIYIGYHLKSGKTVYRAYYLPETEELTENIGKVYDNWEYREKLLPTSYLRAEDIEYLYGGNFYTGRKQVDAKGENLENIYKTYKTELESMTFEQSSQERILGYLTAEKKMQTPFGDEYTDSTAFPIYESFTKTRALLKEQGIPVEGSIPAEDILEIRIYKNSVDEYDYKAADVSYMEEKEYTFKEKEEIAAIVEALTFEDCRYGVASNVDYSVHVELLWEDRNLDGQINLYLMNSKKVDVLLEKLQ